MILEKSCGVLIYRKSGEILEFLAVKSKTNGHWGLPKGRMEKDETEKETAIREVLEETGLNIILLDGFKTKIEYQLSDGSLKEVVYFIGTTSDCSVNIQREEIEQFRWEGYEGMFDLLTFDNDKNVLTRAACFLNSLAN